MPALFQVATIAGPAIGGIAYALFRGPEGVYAIAVTVSILSVLLTLRIHPLPTSPEKEMAAERARQPAHRARGFPFHSQRRS